MSRPFACLLSFWSMLMLALASGCSYYQLGTQGKLAFQTLYIENVRNDAGLPQATALFGTQLREAFLRDGRVTIVNSAQEADATLSVTLADFSRGIATMRADDAGLARKLELNLSAFCTLHNNRTNQNLFERRNIVVTRQAFNTPSTAPADSDQLQAEYQSMPLIAATLADKVAHATLDVW